jgi:hypothetical protein
MNVLSMLDRDDDRDEARPDSPWFDGIEDSLKNRQAEWLSCMAVELLSDGPSWVLLSWIEVAATKVVRARSGRTLETAVFAMVLLTRSRLDWRDVSVVGALLHRGAILANLRYEASVAKVCARSGPLGDSALDRLTRMDSATPPTHVEAMDGDPLVFSPRPSDFDVADLERWLDG